MRILHVQKTNGIGGSERHLHLLLPALDDAGHDVRMCVAGTGDYQLFTEPLRELGVPVNVVPAGPHLNPLLYVNLVREIRHYRPDLVHTHLIHADVHGQPAAWTCKVPSVSSVHGAYDYLYRQPYNAVLRAVGTIPRRTIAISHYVAESLTRAAVTRSGTIRTIHYGIDASTWMCTEGERSLQRERLRLAKEDIAIGVGSRLIQDKGHEFLIDAFGRAAQRVPALRLLVAGDGPLRARLEAQAQKVRGKVTFLGFVSDMRDFVNACDIFCFPTLPGFGEGFGLAALEAMAAGRPLIATRVGPLSEVVDDGATGILIAPGDVAELSSALVRLARDSTVRATLGRAGAQRARELFGLERMVQGTLNVYEEVRAGSSSRRPR